jgi:CRISPR/Cas system-associated protein Cas10 (large subunit of type III CRISPR-Cas system)
VSRWLPDRNITISIGITLAESGDTVSSVLRRADEALYEAKRGGRNRCVARIGGAAGVPVARGTPAADAPAPVVPAGSVMP